MARNLDHIPQVQLNLIVSQSDSRPGNEFIGQRIDIIERHDQDKPSEIEVEERIVQISKSQDDDEQVVIDF